MEKQYLKRIACGFSALALALSMVTVFPAGRAKAVVPEGMTCEEGDTTDCRLEIEIPNLDDVTYTYDGEPVHFEGYLVGTLLTKIDGAEVQTPDYDYDLDEQTFSTYLGGFIPREDPYHVEFYLEEDPATAVEFDIISKPYVNINKINKAVNAHDSFTVAAQAGLVPEVFDLRNMEPGFVCNTPEPVCYAEAGWEAAEGLVTVVETTAGQYRITPTVPGYFYVHLGTTDAYGNIDAVGVPLSVANAQTEAATTVPDLMDDLYNTPEMDAAVEADENLKKVNGDPNATDEEKNAAAQVAQDAIEAWIELANKKLYQTTDLDVYVADYLITSGVPITTEIHVEEMDEADLEEEFKDALLSELDITFADNVRWYDIWVELYADGENMGELYELSKKQIIMVDLGETFAGPAAGFRRIFKVLSLHWYFNEETEEWEYEIIEIDDINYNPLTHSIDFLADKFSLYLVAYKDVLAASVDTGEFTGEGASATASTAASVVATAVVIALIGAIKFAKTRKN